MMTILKRSIDIKTTSFVCRKLLWGALFPVCCMMMLSSAQAQAVPDSLNKTRNGNGVDGFVLARVGNNNGGLSSRTVSTAQQALKLAKAEKWAEASAIASSVNDPVLNALIDWYLFRSDYARQDFMSLANFVNQYQDWPRTSSIRLKIEDIFPKDYPDDYAYRWYKAYPPISYDGIIRYGTALKNLGQGPLLQQELDKWFPKAIITPQEQSRLVNLFGTYIGKDTLINRFHSALLSDQYSNARAVARILGNGYPTLAEARIALATKAQGVNAKIAKVPAHLAQDEGMALERVSWRRKADNMDGAIALMKTINTAVKHRDTLDLMWNERHILIRDLVERKNFNEAYALATAHQQDEGFKEAQAQWLTGWIALRYVNKPMEAFKRFDALFKAVKTPISRARAAYWAGRASEKIGDKQTAAAWYGAASKYPTVFYGQMGMDKLGVKADYTGKAEQGLIGRDFDNYPKVRAATFLHQAGLQDDAEVFLRHMVTDATDGKISFSALAKLAKNLDAPHLAVHIAKKAENNGHILLKEAFPVIMSRNDRVAYEDMALIHGLIRQESGFYTRARSRTGALGLMQLMPPTARETAGKLGIKYSKTRLTEEPSYNIKLGTFYIRQMLERFDGSYPLAIAAYNGGPGRVGRWTKELSDPRGYNQYDLIDWIETIPVYETRNYVQRVTEAMRVYADIFHRLGYTDTMQTAWNQE